MLNAEAYRRSRERREPAEHEAAGRERRRRASLHNSARRETQHSLHAAIIFTGFIAAHVTERIFAGANKEVPTFCDPKSP
jgi:hypothetical protein